MYTRNLIKSGLILVAVLLLVTVHQLNSQSPGKGKSISTSPSINWNPNTISASVAPGGGTQFEITLNALAPLGDVSISPVSEIDPYVDVVPTMLNDVKAGDSIQLRVVVSAGATASLGLFSGTIQVRERVARQGQGRVFARPLPVQVLISQEGAVAGTDSDGNGTWDYIDNYINSSYPGTDNQPLRSGLHQFARAIQGALLNPASKDIALQFAAASNRAQECVFYRRPADADDILADLEANILNNRARSLAFLMWSEQSAGQVFAVTPLSQRAASCTAQ